MHTFFILFYFNPHTDSNLKTILGVLNTASILRLQHGFAARKCRAFTDVHLVTSCNKRIQNGGRLYFRVQKRQRYNLKI